MTDKNTREEKLKILFATHPKTDTFFLTSNDKAFFDKPSADAYAQTLKDRKVEKYTRNSVPADEELEKDIARSKAEESPADQAEAKEEDAPAEESPAEQAPKKSSSKPKSK